MLSGNSNKYSEQIGAFENEEAMLLRQIQELAQEEG
jgi:hypothetical protein